MNDKLDNNDYDLNQIIVRPLYFGLVSNILIPMALLLVCYYLHVHYGRDNKVGELANQLFFIFAALALFHAVFALWWRSKRLRQPMVRRKETFEQDVTSGLLSACRPVFVIIAAISVYGFLYFFLTGRFTEMVVFVFISFVVFQLVRPRYGFARKMIAQQQKLIKQGQFRSM